MADADTVYRERVYCYELYHQLRCLWGDFKFSLGGEIDKSGNPHFEDGPYARSKPDLVIHTPGNMAANLTVVEVKPATAEPVDIRHDLKKLVWFCRNARYFKGVFLVYGETGEPEMLAARIRGAANAEIDFSILECFYHRRVGERTQRVQP